MAGKHEQIQAQLLIDWSAQKRGRLYNMRVGLAVPVNGEFPVWFGPLGPKFKGFPDCFGFEFCEMLGTKFPVYGVIDVKTIAYPTLSKEQKNYMSYVKSIGGFAYIAMESKQEGELYYLKEFEG